MRREAGGPSVAYGALDAGRHLSGVVGLLASLEWDNFDYDLDLTRKALTAPGVTTIVAAAGETGEVVGFAQVFADGVFQAHSAFSRSTRVGTAGASAGASWRRPSRGWGRGAWTS